MSRPPRTFKGSKRRLRRIRLRDNLSVGFWVVVAIVMVALFAVVPWLIHHPPAT